jgi:hypothetical protein
MSGRSGPSGGREGIEELVTMDRSAKSIWPRADGDLGLTTRGLRAESYYT